MKFRNQARKIGAAIKEGRFATVEYHITAPDIDPKLIEYLKKTIPGVKIYRYDSIFSSSRVELGIENVPEHRGSIAPAGEDEDVSQPARKTKTWDEKAWIWALQTYSAKRFRGFSGDPVNVRKVVFQPHTKPILDGLQRDLNRILMDSRITDKDRESVESLKQTINQWGPLIDIKKMSINSIREFSKIIRDAKDLIDRYPQA